MATGNAHQKFETKFEEGTSNLPKSLRQWIERNQDKVAAISYGGGYCMDDGRGGNAYDVLCRNGWSTDEGYHTIIESTAARTLSILRSLTPCDCEECRS